MNLSHKYSILLLLNFLIFLQLKSYGQILNPDSLNNFFRTSLLNSKGNANTDNLSLKSNFKLVLYNSRNCNQCFFNIQKEKNEKAYLVVLQPTNEISRYLFIKKFNKAYSAIYFLKDSFNAECIPFQFLTVIQNQSQTPIVISYKKKVNEFQFLPFDSIFRENKIGPEF